MGSLVPDYNPASRYRQHAKVSTVRVLPPYRASHPRPRASRPLLEREMIRDHADSAVPEQSLTDAR
jgi:hypothetical protein